MLLQEHCRPASCTQAIKVGSYADAIADGGKSPARLDQTTGTPLQQPPWLADTPDIIKYLQVPALLNEQCEGPYRT